MKKIKPFPRKKFKVIYIDPPWPYRDKGAAGKRGASQKYKILSMIDLMNLPIEKLAARNCALFMWAVDPMIPEALAVMKAWQFQYRRVSFVWVKLTKDRKKFRMGLGRWTRSNAEFLLLGIRGHPKRVEKGVNQVIGTIPRGHSVKPDEARKAIVKLMGDVPRIELFARGRKGIKDGWVYWGDQV